MRVRVRVRVETRVESEESEGKDERLLVTRPLGPMIPSG